MLVVFGTFQLFYSTLSAYFVTRSLTQLLTDLNLFVLNVDLSSNKQDVLSITSQKPDRERQKLAREQNVLKLVQINSFFSAPFRFMSYICRLLSDV